MPETGSYRDAIRPGDLCVVTDDILVNGYPVFRKNQRVRVQSLEPSTLDPSYVYVTCSPETGSLFHLSHRELAPFRRHALETVGKASPYVTTTGASILLLSALFPFFRDGLEGWTWRTIPDVLIPIVFGTAIFVVALRSLGVAGSGRRDGAMAGIVIGLSAFALWIRYFIDSIAADGFPGHVLNRGFYVFAAGAIITLIGGLTMNAGTSAAEPGAESAKSTRSTRWHRDLSRRKPPDIKYCFECSARCGFMRIHCRVCGARIRDPLCVASFACALAACLMMALAIVGLFVLTSHGVETVARACFKHLFIMLTCAAVVGIVLAVLGDRAVKIEPYMGGGELALAAILLGGVLLSVAAPVVITTIF